MHVTVAALVYSGDETVKVHVTVVALVYSGDETVKCMLQ